ncbi:(Lyso)-N-acylphosphatidylethanolamine lipase-like [Branchiostoma floridae x Branchiostoma belcheri]
MTDAPVPNQELSSSQQSRCRLGRRLRWRPTSAVHLAAAETRVLQHVKSKVDRLYVPISNDRRIWTLKVDSQNTEALPIVLIHGFGAGVGFWLLNIDAFAKHRTVYAFDVLGFGQSSRPKFGTNADAVEEEFVNSIEEWREGVGLEKFILLGHSFGGFLAASYSIKHPDRVKHLILADPWGFPERTEEAAEEQRAQIPVWMRAIGSILLRFNPLSPFRAAGPWGPRLIRKARPDLQAKFTDAFEDFTIIDYLYHCNAQPPSAETAFGHLQVPYGFARNAMLPRMSQLREDVPITFIFGRESWMDSRPGKQTKILRKDSYVDVMYIHDAGHHVYADRPDRFNGKVVWVCSHADRLHQAETRETIMETSI